VTIASGPWAAQVFHLKNARADRDHLAAHPLGGAHVVGRILNKVNGSCGPESPTHLADPFAKNIHPQLTFIREAAKLEIFRQPRRFQLRPAKSIPDCPSTLLTAFRTPQHVRYLADSRQHVRPKPFGLLLSITPNRLERGPQDPGIGLAVIGDAVNRSFHALDIQQRPVQRIPVCPVRRTQQRSVNIEQIRVRSRFESPPNSPSRRTSEARDLTPKTQHLGPDPIPASLSQYSAPAPSFRRNQSPQHTTARPRSPPQTAPAYCSETSPPPALS
jgi:hypothetical protein